VPVRKIEHVFAAPSAPAGNMRKKKRPMPATSMGIATEVFLEFGKAANLELPPNVKVGK
jgi:hypothetical protein